jgi:hypothetical protein
MHPGQAQPVDSADELLRLLLLKGEMTHRGRMTSVGANLSSSTGAGRSASQSAVVAIAMPDRRVPMASEFVARSSAPCCLLDLAPDLFRALSAKPVIKRGQLICVHARYLAREAQRSARRPMA